ncbi:hypothetical protein FFLO_04810 [Filobasidium floriforme]|uniref:Pyridoxal phosphate phosphatase phospho2 n=1 Tax=Filobasidium floriforme TaxID=5210 RepID=A0A8K0JII9_9TREE|nr:hypothetical protein FFLO_04810 [Filobasidium floriforme]
MPGKQLVVFDFDWSFVDQDTDRFVLEVLSTKLRRKLQTIKSGGSQCTPDVVAECMIDLANDGFTKEQVLDALRVLPLHPAMKRAVTELQKRSPDTTFICLSNSNEIYIDTILKHHGLTDLFTNIITNPAHWDTSSPNTLLVGRLIPKDSPNQHTCQVGCLVNMCKGDELEKWLALNGGLEAFEKVVYVGDGGNDFCPLLRMRKQDVCLVRKGYELEGRIKSEAQEKGLKAEVVYWSAAWEIDE